MKQFFKTAVIAVCVLLAILALGWVLQGNDFFMYKYFAPKIVQVQRETFEESKPYNQGMIQDLRKAQQEYAQADEKGKDALCSIMLHRFADYPEDKMAPDLQSFMDELRQRVNSKKSY